MFLVIWDAKMLMWCQRNNYDMSLASLTLSDSNAIYLVISDVVHRNNKCGCYSSWELYEICSVVPRQQAFNTWTSDDHFLSCAKSFAKPMLVINCSLQNNTIFCKNWNFWLRKCYVNINFSLLVINYQLYCLYHIFHVTCAQLHLTNNSLVQIQGLGQNFGIYIANALETT